jgi:hypothetical protein
MKPEFLVERNGRKFVLYQGLLDLAHERGLKKIETTLVQIPSDLNGNVAICHAVVETSQGTFTGIGDAAPDSVSRMMVPHLIRMAETRSKARALRDATNIGVTAVEEMGELPDDDGRADSGPVHFGGRPIEDEPAELHQPGNRGPARPANVTPTRAREADGRSDAPPATPTQIATIQRMARAARKQIPTENLTRAQASQLISALIGEVDKRSSGGAPGGPGTPASGASVN